MTVNIGPDSRPSSQNTAIWCVQSMSPKGVPQMQTLTSLYIVFVSPDHWREVSLEDDRQMLVVEGLCAYEPQVEGVAGLCHAGGGSGRQKEAKKGVTLR
jgi:hypothetical protein